MSHQRVSNRALLLTEEGGWAPEKPTWGSIDVLPLFWPPEKPFSITPDPRFPVSQSVPSEALGHLLYGIEERKGFITVTGEVGTGKTLLCRALLDRLGSSIRAALIFNSFLSDMELLRSINEDFGISQGGATRKELIDLLERI